MKKILLIWPKFFNYEQLIMNKYQQLGYEVHYYNERPVSSSYGKAILRILPGLVKKTSNEYYNKIIQKNKMIDYDFILIGDSDAITKETLIQLKKCFNRAKMILYLGDSVKNVKGILEKINCFDSIYSFDKQDCKKFHFNFLPFFFADQYSSGKRKGTDSVIYDFSFVGTIHSNRLEILNCIEKIAQKQKMTFYFYKYLQSWFMYYYYFIQQKSFKNTKPSDFQYQQLTAKEIIKICNESRCIIDIQHSNQTGLTMRTFEMMGLKKKLITTNSTIIEYDFYNPKNICIIDPKNIQIPNDFLTEPYEDIPEEIYNNYSLKSWTLRLLDRE